MKNTNDLRNDDQLLTNYLADLTQLSPHYNKGNFSRITAKGGVRENSFVKQLYNIGSSITALILAYNAAYSERIRIRNSPHQGTLPAQYPLASLARFELAVQERQF